MTTLEETGATYTITSYSIEIYDALSLSWIAQIGESSSFTDLTYTIIGLTTGTDYKLRLRAENMHGWGAYSDVVTIRADDVPA